MLSHCPNKEIKVCPGLTKKWGHMFTLYGWNYVRFPDAFGKQAWNEKSIRYHVSMAEAKLSAE